VPERRGSRIPLYVSDCIRGANATEAGHSNARPGTRDADGSSSSLMARHVSPDVPTVLLVQERPDDRAMYAEYLQRRGFAPLDVQTTDEALTRAGDADVIVTDVRLSGSFDGLELVRRLRADGRTRTKWIIVLTAWAMDPSREQALGAGCDVFLSKPCLPHALETEIRRGLVERRPRGARLSRRRSRPAKRRI
jgi:two-component system, cell cycle response regulator DivK